MNMLRSVTRGLGCLSLVICLATGCDDDDTDESVDESPADAGGANGDAGIDASLRPDSSLDAALRDATAADAAVALTEAQVVGIANTVNTGEIEAGTLAQTKGTSASVKEFASMMVTMHQAANTRAAALGISPASSPLMSELMQKAAIAQQTLTSTPQGAAFDRAYVTSQVEMHTEALSTFDSVLLPNAKTPALVAELTRARGEVATHLTQARALASGLDGGT